jgi:DNA-directed RNA polymerase subunit RPC12/RpoP
VVLSDPQDLQKSRPKWWSNCQNCRTTNTVKERKKRNAMATATSDTGLQRTRPTSYSQASSSRLEPKEESKKRKYGHFSESVPSGTEVSLDHEQQPVSKAEELCEGCNQTLERPWITNFGHIICDPCYENAMVDAAEHGQVRGQCEGCNKTVYHWERYDPRKRASNATTAYQSEISGDFSWIFEPDCSVCGREGWQCTFVALPSCTHEPDVCADCFRNWITSQFETSVQDGIRCPYSTCGHKLTHADIKKHASSEDFAR